MEKWEENLLPQNKTGWYSKKKKKEEWLGDKKKLLEIKYRRNVFRFNKKTERQILRKSLQRKHKKTKRWKTETRRLVGWGGRWYPSGVLLKARYRAPSGTQVTELAESSLHRCLWKVRSVMNLGSLESLTCVLIFPGNVLDSISSQKSLVPSGPSDTTLVLTISFQFT